jgi:hypothetical protein
MGALYDTAFTDKPRNYQKADMDIPSLAKNSLSTYKYNAVYRLCLLRYFDFALQQSQSL